MGQNQTNWPKIGMGFTQQHQMPKEKEKEKRKKDGPKSKPNSLKEYHKGQEMSLGQQHD
jgi:hypothetical protein